MGTAAAVATAVVVDDEAEGADDAEVDDDGTALVELLPDEGANGVKTSVTFFGLSARKDLIKLGGRVLFPNFPSDTFVTPTILLLEGVPGSCIDDVEFLPSPLPESPVSLLSSSSSGSVLSSSPSYHIGRITPLSA